MKKTFVMAAAMLFSIATMAQTGTHKGTKSKTHSGSMQTGKDSLGMSNDSDSTSTGKYHSNKKSRMNKTNKTNKMKQKSRTITDTTTTS